MAPRIAVCPTCATRNRTPVASEGHPRCAACHTDLPWLVDVTAAEFETVVNRSTVPVLVDLWAPWCGPCRAVAPALEQLAAERAGTLRIVKVNVDEEPSISTRLGVQGIPTMVLSDRGAEAARQVGALPVSGIRTWIDTGLAEASR